MYTWQQNSYIPNNYNCELYKSWDPLHCFAKWHSGVNNDTDFTYYLQQSGISTYISLAHFYSNSLLRQLLVSLVFVQFPLLKTEEDGEWRDSNRLEGCRQSVDDDAVVRDVIRPACTAASATHFLPHVANGVDGSSEYDWRRDVRYGKENEGADL